MSSCASQAAGSRGSSSRFDAQAVHVEPHGQLVAHVAVHVETGDQGVVNAFEQRVIDDPQGLRQRPSTPLCTDALSKWRYTVSTGASEGRSPFQIVSSPRPP